MANCNLCNKIIDNGLFCDTCREKIGVIIVSFKGVEFNQIRNFLQDDFEISRARIHFNKNQGKQLNLRRIEANKIDVRLSSNNNAIKIYEVLSNRSKANGLNIVVKNPNQLIITKNTNKDDTNDIY